MAKPDSSTENRAETPTTWNAPDDARKLGSDYPNYWVRKTRSGHTFILDDSKDKEHITLQHRSGTMIQLMPDGAFQIVSHRGRYDVTYGENRVFISGAYDTTVDGDSSIKTKGNFSSTTYGNHTTSVKGDSIETTKSKNVTVAEQMDSVIGWETKKVNNSSTEHVMGAKSIISQYGMGIGSLGDAVAIGGATGVGISSGGSLGLHAKGGKLSVKSDGNTVAIDGAFVYINSGQSQPASASTNMKNPPPPSQEQGYNGGEVA